MAGFVNPNLPSLADMFSRPPLGAQAVPDFASPNLDPMQPSAGGAGEQVPQLPSSPFGAPPTVGLPPGGPIAGAGGPTPDAGPSGIDRVIQMLVRALPGLAMGVAGGRHGLSGMGQVAGGISDGLNQISQQDYRTRSLDLREQEIGAAEGQRAEAAKMRIQTAITGIMDRARDDARNFEGSPEEFTKWREQIAASLEQYGAADRVREIRFPNARFLAAAAKEDKDWWDMVVRDQGDKLYDPEAFEQLKMLSRYSAIRGRTISLEDALQTIGLADEDGDVAPPSRKTDPMMLPTGTRDEKTYGVPKVGDTFTDPSAPVRPRMGPAQVFENKNGDLEIVMTDENGTTKRIPVPATDGMKRVGGSNLLEILQSLGLVPDSAAGDLDADAEPTETPEEELERILSGG